MIMLSNREGKGGGQSRCDHRRGFDCNHLPRMWPFHHFGGPSNKLSKAFRLDHVKIMWYLSRNSQFDSLLHS